MSRRPTQPTLDVSSSGRRKFLAQSTGALVGAALTANLAISRSARAAGSDTIRIGLVGCGGRGMGATRQALLADPHTQLVAVADALEDRLQDGLKTLLADPELAGRVTADRDRRFVGFDGYERVIASDVDVVLLATPPHFRPQHLRACIDAGKHVFAEKPVAVDAPGVRSVMEATEPINSLLTRK